MKAFAEITFGLLEGISTCNYIERYHRFPKDLLKRKKMEEVVVARIPYPCCSCLNRDTSWAVKLQVLFSHLPPVHSEALEIHLFFHCLQHNHLVVLQLPLLGAAKDI